MAETVLDQVMMTCSRARENFIRSTVNYGTCAWWDTPQRTIILFMT